MFQTTTYVCRLCFQFPARWALVIVLSKREPESVSLEPGNDMEVNVENLLKSRLAISQKQVDSLTPEIASSQSAGETLRYPEHMCCSLPVKVLEPDGVAYGYDQQVAGINRLDVHESGNRFIPKNETGRLPALQDITKDTRVHFGCLISRITP